MPQQAIYCYLFGTNNSMRSVIMETHKQIKALGTTKSLESTIGMMQS